MAQTKIEITTDEKQAERAYQKLAAAEERLQQQSQQTGKVTGQTARQIAAANEAAASKSVYAYNQILRELRKQGPEGRAQAKAIEQYLRDTGQAGRRSMATVGAELRQLDPTAASVARKVTEDMRNAADTSSGAFTSFGQNAYSQLTSIVGGYVGIQQAIQTIIDLNEKVIETNREAFASFQQVAPSDRQLSQVLRPGETLAEFRGKADTLAARYGMGREESRNLLFSARSEGFEGALDFIGAASVSIAPESQATVAGQVPGLFKGQNVTPAEAINAVLAGAQSSRLNFEDLTRAIPTLAASAAPGGSSFEETVGSLSVLASSFKTGEQAADRLSALAAKTNLDPTLSGLGLTESVRTLRDVYTPEQRAEFLGASKELNEAYNAFVANFDAIQQRTGQITAARATAGTDASPVADAIRTVMTDPKAAAAINAKRDELNLEIERENRRAVAEANRQAATDRALLAAERSGVSPYRIGAAETLVGKGQSMFGPGGEGLAIGLITEDQLANLVRDFSLATRAGDNPAAEAGLLAATRLRQRRQREGNNAILGPDAVAQYIQGTTGELVSPSSVTESMRQRLTAAIESQAAGARGLERSLTASAIDLFGQNTPFVNLAFRSAASEGSASAAELQRSVSDLIAAVREGNDLQRAQLEANRETATNTQRRPPNQSDTVNNQAGQTVPDPI